MESVGIRKLAGRGVSLCLACCLATSAFAQIQTTDLPPENAAQAAGSEPADDEAEKLFRKGLTF